MNWKSNFQVLNFVSVSYERLSGVFLGVGLYILIGLYTQKNWGCIHKKTGCIFLLCSLRFGAVDFINDCHIFQNLLKQSENNLLFSAAISFTKNEKKHFLKSFFRIGDQESKETISRSQTIANSKL